MNIIDCGTKIIVRCNDEMEQSKKGLSTMSNLQKSREKAKSLGEKNIYGQIGQGTSDIDISKLLQKTNKRETLI